MKKNLMNLTLLAGGLLAATAGAKAESLRVKVPFAFTASGTKLPPGEYSISEIAGNPTVLLIAASNSGARAMVFARMTDAAGASASHPVVFENEGSDGMALVSVRTPVGSFELSTPSQRVSLAKNAALAIGGTK